MTEKLKAVARKKQYSAPALEKGLDILELLSGETDGLNIGEITRRLGRSVGELFRMLVVLEQRGYVAVQPGTDSYALTLKLFELSHHFPLIKKLTATAGPIMRHLAFDIEQSCHLVLYYEGKGHVVAQEDPPSARILTVRLGAEVPLITTCSGHVLLAFSDAERRQGMLESIPDHHPKSDKKELDRIVERVVRKGHENLKSAQISSVQDIGFPVFDFTGQVVAALAVPFLAYLDGSHPIELNLAQERVQLAANSISAALGYNSA